MANRTDINCVFGRKDERRGTYIGSTLWDVCLEAMYKRQGIVGSYFSQGHCGNPDFINAVLFNDIHPI